jgi:hypothetical protein
MARSFTPDGRPVFQATFIAKQLARIALRDEPDGVWRCRYCRRKVQRTDVPSCQASADLPWPERYQRVRQPRAVLLALQPEQG